MCFQIAIGKLKIFLKKCLDDRSLLQRDELAEDDEAGIVVFIGAGGEYHDPVVARDLHACFDIRPAGYPVEIVGVALGAGEGEGVGRAAGVGYVGAEYIYSVVPVRRVEIHTGVLIEIFLLGVFDEGAEHRPVVHVVAVDNGDGAGKVPGAAVVDEDGAVAGVGTVEEII